MSRWRFTDFLAAVLLLAAMLLSAGWIRSRDHAEAIVFHGPSGQPGAIIASQGILYIVLSNVPVWHAEPWSFDLRKMSLDQFREYRDVTAAAANWNAGWKSSVSPTGKTPLTPSACFGFGIGKGTDALSVPGTRFAYISAPQWAVVPVLLILPARRITRAIRRHLRRKRGQCENCGYDLRASPGKCPECGDSRAFK